MNYEDTICHKIDVCQREIQNAIKTGNFDALKLANTLSSIHSDALSMENALKTNKVLRLKHNIDPEYREMMKESTTPPGTNKLEVGFYKIDKNEQKPRYELTLLDTRKNEVVYKNKLFAFIMCAVEKIDNVDPAGIINGQTECFAVGHDLSIFYAFDQLRQKFARKLVELALKKENTFKKPLQRKERRELVKEMNKGKI